MATSAEQNCDIFTENKSPEPDGWPALLNRVLHFGCPSCDLSGGGKKRANPQVRRGALRAEWVKLVRTPSPYARLHTPPGSLHPPWARWWMSWLMERIHARQICPLNNQSQHCSVINNFLGSPRTLSKADWITAVNTIRSMREIKLWINCQSNKGKYNCSICSLKHVFRNT